eukprot:TRINITY_DN25073_c0_g1_i2.p1 TRINITY_DN25073_c0_g1~~TRINITY_DN25073_c0_g1_i2.p1  ORF type:complete len:583 (+),score=83.73 TRINITY_DN25073_c0_g1_i2:129-1877(+)
MAEPAVNDDEEAEPQCISEPTADTPKEEVHVDAVSISAVAAAAASSSDSVTSCCLEKDTHQDNADVEVATTSPSADSDSAPPVDGQRDPKQHLYTVSIRCFDGVTENLQVPGDLRGSALKALIFERLRVPAERQRLIFRGRVIQDEEVVSQHITEDGQTIHMVQRPDFPIGSQSQSSSGTFDAPASGPHVRFHVTGAGGSLPGVSPGSPGPAEVRQILSTLLGIIGQRAAGAGAGGDQLDAEAGAASRIAAFGALGSSFATRSPTTPPVSQSRSACPSWLSCLLVWPTLGLLLGFLIWFTTSAQVHEGFVKKEFFAKEQASVVDGLSSAAVQSMPWYTSMVCYYALSLLLGLPTVYAAFVTSLLPSRIGGYLLGENSATPTGQNLLVGQSLASALPLSQLVFQEIGLSSSGAAGHGGGDLGGTGQTGGLIGANSSFAAGLRFGQMQQDTRPESDADRVNRSDDAPPWRDLQCLNLHMNELLGRSGQLRAMPPENMPSGELHAFLAVLQGSISQLGVGINDIQGLLGDGARPSPQQLLNFTSALDAAAQCLRGLSVTMRGVPDGDAGEVGVGPTAETTLPESN